MSSATHMIQFDGGLLARGFWLYVWEVTTPEGEALHYVGRTGDSSSLKAQSPFNRIGQHLGFAEASNQLRKHLASRGVEPERCRFRFAAHGPIAPEAATRDEHRARRDFTAALERELARSLRAAGYEVLNTVSCKKPLDATRFQSIRAAFAAHFARLAEPATGSPE